VGRRNRAFEAPDIIAAFTDLERQLASPEGDTHTSEPARPLSFSVSLTTLAWRRPIASPEPPRDIEPNPAYTATNKREVCNGRRERFRTGAPPPPLWVAITG
jgi:hypothetical protein